MKRKISNLEEYYLELQEENPSFKTPFNNLSPETLDILECSTRFKKFLIRRAWTKLFIYCCLIIIPIGVFIGAIILNNHR